MDTKIGVQISYFNNNWNISNVLSGTSEELKNIIWSSRVIHYSNSIHVLYTSVY